MNHTPEPGNRSLSEILLQIPCGWCHNTHMAEKGCCCPKDCGNPYCAAAVSDVPLDPFAIRFL